MKFLHEHFFEVLIIFYILCTATILYYQHRLFEQTTLMYQQTLEMTTPIMDCSEK